MTAEKKDRKPLRIKNLADLKRHIRLGTELVATAHQYHPDIVGLTRVVTKVQTNGFYSKIKDQPDHKWSTCNHGLGFWSPFNKAGAYRFTDSTVQVLNTRKNDGSILYEMELYDGEQSMSEQNKEVPDMNEWDRLHRQAQRYKEAYGISTSRGTVGDDIKALQELGVEIAVESSTQKRYYMIGRRFDLPELKTMIDAIESARFIPKEKSAALVKKIGSLTSFHNTEKLVRNVDVENRIKADNEKVYYIMEALNEAINSRKKVSFQYFTFNVRKEQKLRHDGYTYVFSPYKLIWNGDYYYVVGYSEKHKGIGSFRIDRIVRQPTILDEDAKQPPRSFDLNDYLNSMFRMYNGERKQIELVCDNDMMDAIIDKFGKDVTVLANDMKSFRTVVSTAVGPVFYSWVFGFGGKVSIKSPEDVKKSYAAMVKQAAEALTE